MQRIRRRRTPGWTMPEGAAYVGRGTPWGNPYVVGHPWDERLRVQVWPRPQPGPMSRSDVVLLYGRHLETRLLHEPGWLEPLRYATALACWCRLDEPCHADRIREWFEHHPTLAVEGQPITFGLHRMPDGEPEGAPAWPPMSQVRAAADARWRKFVKGRSD